MNKKKYLSLREIQLEEVKILDYVVNILDNHKIPYSLYGGTLLGAIRHKGFIPWDDDIDVMMLRKDYDKFLETIKKEHSNVYIFSSYEVSNSLYTYCKICNKNIIVEYEGGRKDYLWIDIIPFDNCPSESFKFTKWSRKSNYYEKLYNIRFLPYNEILHHNINITKKIFKLFIKFILTPIPVRYFVKKIITDAKKYNQYNLDTACPYVLTCKKNRVIKKSHFNNLKLVNFENRKYKAIGNYDEYLKQLYGNYMELPPAEEMITHNIKAFKL